MVVATAAVMVLPAVIVGALGALGVISSVWIGVALSALLALAATSLGSAYWRRRTTGDALFSDLLLWGWLRRGRMERRLGRADDLLDEAGTADPERKGEILRDLGVALDAQDPYLDGHSRRVARYAAMTAHRLELPDEQAHRVRTAAMIHDIGKLRIPEAIVNKPGRLTDDEFELMKEHAAEGGKMVESLGDAALAAAVRSHHERWDGSGYPDGLSGEQIPLAARIISVVDTFDALASARSYRAATPHAKVLRIIEQEAGRQLDPDAARAFISCYSDRRGAAMWAAIASLPRRVAERLSIAPGEIAGVLAATLTAPLAVVAGAMAADTLPVTSDSPQSAISQSTAQPAQTPTVPTASSSPSTPPASGTETPPVEGADPPPGEDTARVPAQGRGSEQSERDTAGAQATSTASPGRDVGTASAPSEPPPSQPAAAAATPAPDLTPLILQGSLPPSFPTPQPTAEPTRQPLPTPSPSPEPILPEPIVPEPIVPEPILPEPIVPERTPEPLPPLLAETLPVFPDDHADAADAQQGRLHERRLDGPRVPEPGAVHRRRQSP